MKMDTSGLPLGEHGQQHGEVDGSRGIVEHLIELLLGADAAQLVVGGTQVVLAQDAILVAVHQLEALLEFSHLLLAEHGEDIAAGTADLLAGSTGRTGLGRTGGRGRGGGSRGGLSSGSGLLFLLLLLLLLLSISLH